MNTAGTDTTLIRIESVSRSFDDVVALDAVSMEIRENEFFALLGPSGCGKTTLLRVLAGFEHPDSGSVAIGTQDLLSLPPNKRPVNMMFQSYALFPHMSVEKNVGYGLEREGRQKDEIGAREAEVLTTVGLTDKARTRPAQLSGGQRQRVALARAIIKRPRLLLLDEPLSALDRKIRAEMQLELKRLQHEVGITFVVVTHDQEEAMSMADRVAVMAAGRVQQLDTPMALYRNPGNLFVAGFIGASNLLAGSVEGGVFASANFGLIPGCGTPTGITAGHLVVRPEDVRIVAPSDGAITGVVADVQFHGAASSVIVDAAGIVPVTMTAMVTGMAAVRPGDHVGLVWDLGVVVEDSLK